MVLPKGVRASPANLKCCIPNGIPMIVIISRELENRCSSDINIPPKTIHRIFISMFIILKSDELLFSLLQKGI